MVVLSALSAPPKTTVLTRRALGNAEPLLAARGVWIPKFHIVKYFFKQCLAPTNTGGYTFLDIVWDLKLNYHRRKQDNSNGDSQ